MGWQTADYQYDLDGLDPFDYCTSFRVITEGMAAREGTLFRVPGLHGEQLHPNRLFEGHNIIIDTVLRYTDANDAVTHVNGAAGHVYANLAAMKRAFGKTTGPVTLTRMNPDGLVGGDEFRIRLNQIQPVEANGDVDHQFIWTARAVRPFWESTTLDSTALATGNFNPGGDAPVDDAIITITGDGTVTNNTTGTRIRTVGAGPNTVVIDCGARTVKVGGNNRDEWFETGDERWLHFEAGVNNSMMVTGTVNIQWREKRH
jgi:hypothetical protein